MSGANEGWVPIPEGHIWLPAPGQDAPPGMMPAPPTPEQEAAREVAEQETAVRVARTAAADRARERMVAVLGHTAATVLPDVPGERGRDTGPEALLEGHLYRGHTHEVFAKYGSGKTLLAMDYAVQVMMAGGTVVWLDYEMGARKLYARFAAFEHKYGLTPAAMDALVGEQFTSYTSKAFNDLTWPAVLAERPALVVADAVTGLYAAHGVSPTSFTEVTGFLGWWAQAVTTEGGAVVMLDHPTTSGSTGEPAFGRETLNAVDVARELTVTRPFNRTTVGEVRLVLVKDREGGGIPERALLAIGGSPFGIDTVATVTGASVTRESLISVLSTTEGRTANAVYRVIGGSKDGRIADGLDALVAEGVATREPGRGNAVLYRLVPAPEAEQE